MDEFNEWIIEDKYLIRFPANINSLSPKQFRKVLQLYYQDHSAFVFRMYVFFSIAQVNLKTRAWFVWHLSIKRFLSYILPVRYKVFRDGDMENVIMLFTDFLIEKKGEEAELLAKQLIPVIKLPVFRFLGKYSPKFTIKGHSDYYESMTFENYRDSEKAFTACNLKEPGAFDELIRALYKSRRKIEDWQLAFVPESIKRGVYFEYNDIREYWKRSYEAVFDKEDSKEASLDEITSDDIVENMQVWMHYIADEKPTNYEAVNKQPVYNILFAWNEIRKKQKLEKEYYDNLKRNS
ncbi:hypothetical protein [Emticicia fontis]